MIRELREELEAVKALLAAGQDPTAKGANPLEIEIMKQQVAENERLMAEMNMSWEERLNKSREEMVVAAKKAEELVCFSFSLLCVCCVCMCHV